MKITLLRLSPLCFSLLTVATGCSDDNTPELTESTFCEQWGEEACSAEPVSRCEAEDVEACQTSQAAFCGTLLVGTFDDRNASSCLSAVRRAYADGDLDGNEMKLVLRLEGACGQIMRGSADEGESCSRDKDCDAPAGFQCLLKGTETTGSCEDVATIAGGGDDCTALDTVCEEGRYCDGSNCLTGKAVSSACTVDRECALEAFCQDGACVEKLAVSVDCASDSQCAEGVCYDFGEDGKKCSARAILTRTDPLCDNLR